MIQFAPSEEDRCVAVSILYPHVLLDHPDIPVAAQRIADHRYEFAQRYLQKTFDDAIRVITQMDDAGESMAMALEDLLAPEGPGDMDPTSVAYDNIVCESKVAAAKKAVATWRAFRPSRGLAGNGGDGCGDGCGDASVKELVAAAQRAVAFIDSDGNGGRDTEGMLTQLREALSHVV